MRRLLDSLIVLGIVSAPMVAAAGNGSGSGSADDPAEVAAQKAAVAKKDLKPEPAKPTSDAQDKVRKVPAKKIVRPKVKHAHDAWMNKQLHDPTDMDR